ncbi:exopolyphosphatase [Eubacteriaceae bacterium ES3]|nr:exopolyphosphatase [Eubacteriaceae bacterium ES3]
MIKRFSVIYIGSNKCELIIGQRGKGCINILDRASYPIRFGSQSFSQGFIDFKLVYALCQTINDYIGMSKAFDVDSIKILGTTALREAKNQIYILEQIRINTGGYEVEILDQEEEIHLIYRHMILKCESSYNIIEQKNGDQMIAAISSGNLSVALLKKGVIDYHQTAELGYLKMKHFLRSIEENTERFETLLNEFIGINTREITENIDQRNIQKLFVSSHEVEMIARLYGCNDQKQFYDLEVEGFEALYNECINLTMNQLMRKYEFLTANEAETLNHTLILYLKLIKETGVKKLTLIPMSIGDAIMDNHFQVMKTQRLMEWIEEGSYQSAIKIGEKYHISIKHAKQIEMLSLKIFDALKKHHEMGRRERMLLSMLAYLQGVGMMINSKDYWIQSRHIIENTDMIGITTYERQLMGLICELVKSQVVEPEMYMKNVDTIAFLKVAKLTAILKLALALDQSDQQKVKKIACRVKEEQLQIEVSTGINFQLEEYFFKYSSYTMEKIYGIKPVLKIKRVEL